MRRQLLIYSCLAIYSIVLPLQAATYTDKEKGFSLEYNDTLWRVVPKSTEKKTAADVDMEMAKRTLVTLERIPSDDKYHTRFSVVIDDLKKYEGNPLVQLTKYYKDALEFLKNQRFRILSTDPTKLPKVSEPAFEIVATQRDFGLTTRQLIIVHEKQAYLLTASTRNTVFDAQKAELAAVFDSFAFSSPTAKAAP